MGITVLRVEVANPARPKTAVRIEFVVDSGAVYSVVPGTILRRLGITPLAREEFRLADGSRVVRKKGIALFRYGRRIGGADVIFGQKGDSTLLGALTLEALGLSLDPLRRELKPLPLILGSVSPPVAGGLRAQVKSNTEKGVEFRIRARSAMARVFGIDLDEEVALPVGSPPTVHRFDLASLDREYIGEAKAFTWTVSGNVPSAKITTLREAVQYLQQLPPNVKPFIVVAVDHHPRRRESLAEYFVRLNGHLLRSVAVYEMDATDQVRAVRSWPAVTQ